MKLSQMSRKQLEAKAKKQGLSFSAKTSDVALRNMIRRAKKAAQGEEAPEPAASASAESGWPAAWPVTMREEYYHDIVGKPMPKSADRAYQHLLKIIDERVPLIIVTKQANGEPDCFGAFYDPAMDYCNALKGGVGCPSMPLCKATCERRPDLRKLAEAILYGEKEEAATSDSEAQEALTVAATTSKPETKAPAKKAKAEEETAKRPKAAKVAVPDEDKGKDGKRYYFKGVFSQYRAMFDGSSGDEPEPTSLALYKWINKHRDQGFTRHEMVDYLDRQLGLGEDAEAVADSNIDYMVGERDVEVR